MIQSSEDLALLVAIIFSNFADNHRMPPISLDIDSKKHDLIIGVIKPENKSDIVKVETLTGISERLNEIGIPRLRKKRYLDSIPLNDEYTLNLFRQGKTEDIFQFQSNQMREYLVQLRPDNFMELVVLNTLYRPCTIELIPEYIRRKHEHIGAHYSQEGESYILDETYGLTIYQEQAIQLLDAKSAMAYIPKSHVIGQTMIAYWQAYQKIHC